MFALRHSLQKLTLSATPSLSEFFGALRTSVIIPSKCIATNVSNTNSNVQSEYDDTSDLQEKSKYRWLDYNKTFFPIQGPDEERRPAYVCHMKANVKYSPKKMWYIAGFVRGMTVDEAIKQLSFMHKKGAVIAKETIKEAQELAVQQHNVEFKSNLWVAESFCTKGFVIKGVRRHCRGRLGSVRYQYCHYFVRLEEGKPPENYYLPAPKTGEEKLEEWLKQMRMRKITNSL